MPSQWSWPARGALVVLPSCLAFFTSPACEAGGVWISESGGSDMAMAGAGSAALALDGTTLAANPAGIARLPGTVVTLAMLPASLHLEFEGSGSTPGSAHNQSGTALGGSAFAVHSGSQFSWGLGLYSYAGLGADLGDEWVGRRVIEREQIRSFNVAPAIAWRVSDRLQVGATLRAQYTDIDASIAVNNSAAFYGPPAGLPDGHLTLRGHSWSPGGDLGVAYQPRPDVQLGLAWTSAVHHTIELDVTANDLHPVLGAMLQQAGPTSLSFALPQQALMSATWQASPDTLLAGTVRWQDWSVLGQARQTSGFGTSRLFADGLRDTWGASVGVRHRLRDDFSLSAGLGYDSDPSPDGAMPGYFPVASQLRVGLGGDWQPRDDLTIRLALSVVQQGDVHVEQRGHPLPLPGVGPLTGTYPESRLYLAAIAVDYRR